MHPLSPRLVLPALALLAAAAAPAQTLIHQPASFPIVIDKPGHYRLAQSLQVPAGKSGIHIQSPDVVLDLGGHTLRGPGGCDAHGCPEPVPNGSFSGVVLLEYESNFSKVRNGTITGFSGSGVSIPQNYLVVLEDLVVSENHRAGVTRRPSDGQQIPPTDGDAGYRRMGAAVLRRITATRNGIAGIQGFGMVIEHSEITRNFGSGIRTLGFNHISDSVINRNSTYGVRPDNDGVAVHHLDTVRSIVSLGNPGRWQYLNTGPASMGGNFTPF